MEELNIHRSRWNLDIISKMQRQTFLDVEKSSDHGKNAHVIPCEWTLNMRQTEKKPKRCKIPLDYFGHASTCTIFSLANWFAICTMRIFRLVSVDGLCLLCVVYFVLWSHWHTECVETVENDVIALFWLVETAHMDCNAHTGPCSRWIIKVHFNCLSQFVFFVIPIAFHLTLDECLLLKHINKVLF